jgi:hypothetical protein
MVGLVMIKNSFDCKLELIACSQVGSRSHVLEDGIKRMIRFRLRRQEDQYESVSSCAVMMKGT